MRHTDTTNLGSTDVEVTIMGVGTNPLGGLHEDIPLDEAVATVERCWDVGIRYFDAARVYGKAEVAVGRALQGKPRNEYVLETKVGRLILESGHRTART